MTNAQKIEIVLELTRDEALGIRQLIGSTYGEIGFNIYVELGKALEHPRDKLGTLRAEGEKRFPGLRGEGRFA